MPSNAGKADTRERCREYWERLYPDVKQPQTYFLGWYREAVARGGLLLDAGCGAGGAVDHPAEAPAMVAVGTDVDFEALKRNPRVRHKVAASADALPFRDGVFDAMVSQYVIEHLENPAKSFAEFARVSRAGASFVYMTTNAAGYLGFMIRHIPRPLQGFIKRRFLKMGESEIYPVHLRGNTRAALERNLKAAGYASPEFVFVGGPFYFSFSYVLFRAAVALERLTDGRLKRLKFYIIGRARKE